MNYFAIAIVFSLPLVLLSISNRKYIVTSSFLSIVFLFIMIVFAGLRYNTGTDYKSYEDIWRYIPSIDIVLQQKTGTGLEHIEIGFRYVISILKFFTDNDRFFFFLMAILALTPLYKGVYNINPHYLIVGLLVYFFIFYIPYVFNGMRQAISMGLLIYSIEYANKNDWKKVFFISIIAGMFHSTGYLISLLYFTYTTKQKTSLFFLYGVFFSFLIHFSGISYFLIFNLLKIKVSYLETWSFKLNYLQIIYRIVLSLILFFLSKKLRGLDRILYEKIFKFYLFGLFIYISLLDIAMMASRFNMFFRVLEVILFSIIFIGFKKTTDRLMVLVIIFTLGFSTLYVAAQNVDNFYSFL